MAFPQQHCRAVPQLPCPRVISRTPGASQRFFSTDPPTLPGQGCPCPVTSKATRPLQPATALAWGVMNQDPLDPSRRGFGSCFTLLSRARALWSSLLVDALRGSKACVCSALYPDRRACDECHSESSEERALWRGFGGPDQIALESP